MSGGSVKPRGGDHAASRCFHRFLGPIVASAGGPTWPAWWTSLSQPSSWPRPASLPAHFPSSRIDLLSGLNDAFSTTLSGLRNEGARIRRRQADNDGTRRGGPVWCDLAVLQTWRLIVRCRAGPSRRSVSYVRTLAMAVALRATSVGANINDVRSNSDHGSPSPSATDGVVTTWGSDEYDGAIRGGASPHARRSR